VLSVHCFISGKTIFVRLTKCMRNPISITSPANTRTGKTDQASASDQADVLTIPDGSPEGVFAELPRLHTIFISSV
jgi:hypothetical protein